MTFSAHAVRQADLCFSCYFSDSDIKQPAVNICLLIYFSISFTDLTFQLFKVDTTVYSRS